MDIHPLVCSLCGNFLYPDLRPLLRQVFAQIESKLSTRSTKSTVCTMFNILPIFLVLFFVNVQDHLVHKLNDELILFFRYSPNISTGPCQLTIFYNGSVCVYDNVSPEKVSQINLNLSDFFGPLFYHG